MSGDRADPGQPAIERVAAGIAIQGVIASIHPSKGPGFD